MSGAWSAWRLELGPMLRLAGPVALAEVGWVSMGIVDTIMVGPLGPAAIGATGVGSSLFLALAVFGIGLLLGLDTLVSQAFGARRIDECHRWLHHGVALALLLAPAMMGAGWLGVLSLGVWGFDPEVLRLTVPYLDILIWSTLPLLLYAAFRRYLQSMNVVQPVMFALVSANVINLVANWVFVYGRLGMPAMGVNGAALATVVSRLYMAAVLLVAIVAQDRRLGTGLFDQAPRVEWARLRRLVRLGFPAAMQVVLEVGVFASASAFAGRLAPVSLAAHQIVLHMAGLTFMVPLGIASAAAVRVGQAVGRRDAAGAACAGWTALGIGLAFMSIAAIVFVAVPRPLVRLFTPEIGVVEVGASLLLIAALFQVFDGMQGVLTGALRGLGDTRSPMLWNLAGHWAMGLPLGYWLCFAGGWGVQGLWIGLSTGLIIVGGVLLIVWARHSRTIASQFASAPVGREAWEARHE
ncbi:MAG TPA: MATE family efflux transporter, partial [Candidatus Limnocylindrales bacterium]|nr:MATE family efflux transporter [Candidatus Limnocylindrales bacterium]